MPSQLIFIPAATTNESYEILRPETVVTEDEVGENDCTRSEMRVMWLGIKEDNGRIKSLFFLRPAPTNVLQRRSEFDGEE